MGSIFARLVLGLDENDRPIRSDGSGGYGGASGAWSRRDRDALIRIVERIGRPWNVSIAANGDISVFVVHEVTSRHINFQSPCESNPTGRAYKTTIRGRGLDTKHDVEWIDGGMREWIDYLELGVDELLAAID